MGQMSEVTSSNGRQLDTGFSEEGADGLEGGGGGGVVGLFVEP